MQKRHLLLLCVLVFGLMVSTVGACATADVRRAVIFMTEPKPAPGENFQIAVQFTVYSGGLNIKGASFSMSASSGIRIQSITSSSSWTNASNADTGKVNFSNHSATYIKITISGIVQSEAIGNQSLGIGKATITLADSSAIYFDSTSCGIPLTLPHAHDMKESARVAATCTASGSITLQCTGCDYLEQVTIAALDHDRQETRDEPTCDKTGSLLIECQRFGCDFVLTKPLDKVPCKYGPDINNAATCLTGGLIKHICNVCGNVETLTLIDALPHNYVTEKERVASTCLQAGYVVLECDGLGCISTRQDELDLAEHDYVQITAFPTCETDGFAESKCSVCGDLLSHVEEPATGHQYEETSRTMSTCTAAGTVYHSCVNPGCDSKVITPLDVAPHQSEEVTVPATCMNEGSKTVKCSECDRVEPVSTSPVLPHNYVTEKERVDSTCLEKGHIVLGCDGLGCNSTRQDELDLAAHDYVQITVLPMCLTDGFADWKCSVCGDLLSHAEEPATGHQYEETGRTVSTCTAAGTVYHSCVNRGCDSKVIISLVLAPHQDEEVTVPATCISEGSKAMQCSVCDRVEPVSTSPVLPHNYVTEKERVDSTCLEKGFIVLGCDGLGCISTRQDELDLAEHDYAQITVLPMCLTDGFADWKCSVCGDLLSHAEEPATGHQYEETGRTVSTCTAAGTVYHSCVNRGCDSKAIISLVLAPHQDEEVTVPATCVNEGTKALKCSVCDKVEPVSTSPVLPHNCVLETDKVDSTCLQAGYVLLGCDGVGCISTRQDELDLADHRYAQVTVPASCEKDGFAEWKCIICGDLLSHVEEPATGHRYEETDRKISTCTVPGIVYQSCINPGCDSKVTTPLALAPHQDEEVTVPATCVNEGTEALKCIVCSRVEPVGTSPVLPHNYVTEKKRVESTCLRKGYVVLGCDGVGCILTRQDELDLADHRYAQVTVPASCEKDGFEEWKCSICGDLLSHVEEPSTGHQYEETGRTVSTCTAEGTVYHSCVNPGCESKVTTLLVLAQHQDEEATMPATCMNQGSKVRKCSVCDRVEPVSTSPVLSHNYVTEKERVDSTCLQKGYLILGCDGLGCISTRQDELDLAEHDYVQITVHASCEKDGFADWKCSVCGDLLSHVEEPATGHQYEETGRVASTCTAAGTVYHSCINPACDSKVTTPLALASHQDEEVTVPATCVNEGIEALKCIVCSRVEPVGTSPVLQHNYVTEKERVESTCLRKGYVVLGCDGVGCILTRQDELDLADHRYAQITVHASCEKDGFADWKCSVCGDLLSHVEEPATGHQYEETGRTVSTCTAAGTVYHSCVNPGCDSKVTTLLVLAQHQDEEVTMPATCMSEGSKGRKCIVCYRVEPVSTSPVLPHNYVTEKERVDSTCLEKGFIVLGCDGLGCNSTRQDELDLAAHDYVQIKVLPMCLTDGSTDWKCSVCGDLLSHVEEPATGHQYEETSRVASTCTAAGTVYHSCVNPGCDSKVTTLLVLAPHQDEEVTVLATCVNEGSKARKCIVCDRVEPVSTSHVLLHNYVTEKERVDSTCLEKGYIVLGCDGMGCISTRQDEMDLAAHDYVQIKVLPMCLTDGFADWKCSVCGDLLSHVEEPATGHQYEETSRTVSTCTAAGAVYHSCVNRRCDSKVITSLAPAPHQDEEVTVPATCMNEGSKARKCIVCYRVEPVSTSPVLLHNYVTEKDRVVSTCLEKGFIVLGCDGVGCISTRQDELDLAEHDYVQITVHASCEKDGFADWKCSVCGDLLSHVEEPATGHQYEETGRTVSTCTAAGTVYHSCVNPGCDSKVTTLLVLAQHQDEEVTVPATCMNEGSKARKCSVCDRVEPVSTLSVLLHNYVTEKERVESTCLQSGYVIMECDGAGCTSMRRDELEPSEHLYAEIVVAAACDEDGFVKLVCSVCGDVLSSETKGATGHHYEEERRDLPTCTAAGTVYHHCVNSGCSSGTTTTLPIASHQDTEITVSATCIEEGSKARKCSVCGRAEPISTLPLLPHNYVIEKDRLDSACLHAGYVILGCDGTGCMSTQRVESGPAKHQDSIVTVYATCINEGSVVLQCSACNRVKPISTSPVLSHNYALESERLDSTCLQAGYTILACDGGGCTSTRRDELEPGEHLYAVIVVAATCDEDGSMKQACSICGDLLSSEVKRATGHYYEEERRDLSTCTIAGTVYHRCINPGCIKTTLTRLPLSLHQDQKITVPATCMIEGSEARKCSACGRVETISTSPVYQHRYALERMRVESTCQQAGHVILGCDRTGCTSTERKELELAQHLYAGMAVAATCERDGSLKQVCGVCGDVLSSEIESATGHHYEETRRVASTCSVAGMAYHSCVNAACDSSVTMPLSLLPHQDIESTTPANCTSDGIRTLKCGICDRQETISTSPALPHNYTIELSRVESTCVQAGLVVLGCDAAGCTSTQRNEMEPGEHLYANIMVDPTCEEDGSAKQACSVCGDVLSIEMQNATGHHYEEESRLFATCTTAGIVFHQCVNPGCSSSATTPLPLASHANETVTIPATCTAEGSKLLNCIVCGRMETIGILTVSLHNYIIEKERLESGCVQAGYVVLGCDGVGCTATQRVESGHAKHQDSETIVAATCLNEGFVVLHCSVCDRVETVSTSLILSHNYSVERERRDSTCLQAGHIVLGCDGQGCSSSRRVDLELSEHSYGEIMHTATCLDDGYKRQVCNVCGDVLSSIILTAMGHCYEETDRLDSTCVVPGLVYHSCVNPNCISQISLPLPLGGHQNEAELTLPASCTKEGSIALKCKTCGEVESISAMPILSHNYDIEVERVESTCKQTGYVLNACAGEGCSAISRDEFDLAEHNRVETMLIPTCTQAGFLTAKCSVCGDLLWSEIYALNGHDYQEALRVSSTCAIKGSLTYACIATECGSTYTDELPFVEHFFLPDNILEATCTSEGNIARECSVCDTVEMLKVLPILGHAFSAWTYESPFVCTENNVQKRTCSRCEYNENTNTSPKYHVWGMLYESRKPKCGIAGEMAQKCTECGSIMAYPTAAGRHEWSEWIDPVDVDCAIEWTKTRQCGLCHADELQLVASAHHAYGAFVIIQPATCTAEGLKNQTCNMCGETRDERIPAVPHSLGFPYVSQAATCEDSGTWAMDCSVCEHVEATKYPALGHQRTAWQKPEESSCSLGWTETSFCDRCANSVNRQVEAQAHTYSSWQDEFAATCLMEGKRLKICTNCGDKEEEVLPLANHQWSMPYAIEDPSCTAAGEMGVSCKVCEDILETWPSAQLPHVWSLWKSREDQTCTADGKEVRACDNCATREERLLPRNGHQPEGWITILDPTCVEQGKKEAICEVCRDTSTESLDALGHQLADFEVVESAGCETPGAETRKCARCDFTETRSTDKLYHRWGSYEEIHPATCMQEGLYQRTCEICVEIDSLAEELKPHDFGSWGETLYQDCTMGGVQQRLCENCGSSESQERDPVNHWFAAYHTESAASCETEGSKTHVCRRCGFEESSLLAAKGHRPGRLKILKRALPYRPGLRGRICKACGAVVEIKPYMPSNESLKVVFSPLGIPASMVAPDQTDLWYMLVPIDITESREFSLPLVADNQYVVGEVLVTVSACTITVTPSYFDDRTQPLASFLRFFTSVEDITTNRIKYRYRGFDLEEPVALSRFYGQDTVLMYLRIEGIYDDRREANVVFDPDSHTDLLLPLDGLLRKMQE